MAWSGHQPGTALLSPPQLQGLNVRGGFRISQELLACVIAMSIYGSAYIAEVVRAGFNTVDRGVIEAARALGLRGVATFFLVHMPLALRAMLPTLTNQYVWLMKATTIGIAVGYADLFLVVSNSINQSGQTFEIIGIFMAGFLVINYLMSSVLNAVNRSIRLKGNQLRATGGSGERVRLLPTSLAELRSSYFGSWRNGVMTVVFGLCFGWLLLRLGNWALVSAVWREASAPLCRLPEAGACWSVISARWRLIFFGLYPADEQWRSAIACIILVSAAVLTAVPRFWKPKWVISAWIGGFVCYYILMRGGVFGLTPVAVQQWGGLALTLFVFAAVVIVGMPIAIVLALLRRSTLQPLSTIVGVIIDTIRSLPLLSLIYTAAVIMPFALPQWLQGEKLYRVILFFALFFACYQAEILRSGFQSLSNGQEEAAKALGIRYRDRIFRVLLPQVIKSSLPPTINQFVVTFKETSLILIIGFFEILGSGSTAYGDTQWSFAYLEVYIFVAAIYFAFTFSMSRYGAFLERRMNVGQR